MSDTVVTTREPLRDVVARSLGSYVVDGDAYAKLTPKMIADCLLHTAEHVDRLYVAVEKLTAAAQLIIDTLKQGQTTSDTPSTQPGAEAR